ncbi:SecYEG protein translocase auxillary subunit [Legionella quinlivanii]|uniref:Sec translocon accessory complex subunit YajC n=1 Tax=Legionella quinlivanii TaxID=45073 RepID=A0A0W0XL19_9GAMM|nr:preprotein translocase subunit YajC [Legionella quinlivanii]KTD45341.1 SecYEG protein translocase auxillary subunit [Legionella quinlivanii]MCW8451394.1 preprotein translocase subunit YajC [Legionella quinlivanii]SEG15525.1 preprotein translocase subunit YajC [Legionella quinlivanii DSM 21216]STY10403.1 SecYEG protein translocase auxillary subunit [Legionella quinlivanii]
MSFFISDAMAAQTQAVQQDGTFSLVMILAIFVLFYFMLIRPQNKRAKEQRELINNLKKGDEIITAGGLVGKVVNLDEQYIKVSLADGVEIMMQRAAVNAILPKGTIKSL